MEERSYWEYIYEIFMKNWEHFLFIFLKQSSREAQHLAASEESRTGNHPRPVFTLAHDTRRVQEFLPKMATFREAPLSVFFSKMKTERGRLRVCRHSNKKGQQGKAVTIHYWGSNFRDFWGSKNAKRCDAWCSRAKIEKDGSEAFPLACAVLKRKQGKMGHEKRLKVEF